MMEYEFGNKIDDIDLLAGMVHRIASERKCVRLDVPLEPVCEEKKKNIYDVFGWGAKNE